MRALIYFETSAWNALARHPDRKGLVAALQGRRDQVFASVVTVGEVLRTGNEPRRKALCDVMAELHGPAAPLLDHPEYLATYAAKAWLREETTVEIRQSPGASLLLSYLEDPLAVDEERRLEVEAWVRAMEEDHLGVFEDLESVGPRVGPKFCSPEVLESRAFNQLLAEKVPLVAKLGLTVEQVVQLSARSDIWKAYRAMAAFTIDAALDQMPRTRPGKRRAQKRPGGPDVRQAIYLGVCDTFVLRDEWFQEVLQQIAAACRLERRVVSAERFFGELLAGTSPKQGERDRSAGVAGSS